MKQRVISAIFLLIILIGSFVISSMLFGIVMLIAAVIGFNEFFTIKYGNKLKAIKYLGMTMLIIIMLSNYFNGLNIGFTMLLPLLTLSIPIVFYNDNRVYSIEDCFYVVGIVCVLAMSFGNIIFLRDSDIGKCIFIFIIAFITDTYAYIGGSLIGRHKLTTISPKKTVEGSLIGTCMGVLAGSVYYYNIVSGTTIFQSVMLSLVLVILSQFGDLIFSSIKRCYDKKDFSNLIPGHGGILDRFDSIIYVSLGLLMIMSII